jgi:hypothetical protein
MESRSCISSRTHGPCVCSTLIRRNQDRVQYKQSRAGPMDRRPAFVARGASLSGGLSSFRVSKTAACTRSLFRPCPGRRVEKPRRLSSKASTEAAVSRWWFVRRGQDPQRPAFLRCWGEIEVAISAPHHMPVRLVSLPLWRTFPATARILEWPAEKICNIGHGR